ncbi:DNA relaxase [Parashewanella curva]|uniref:DNA relaxase n=1 Tax=Parashewanella curva TaxID=2338552 RepID=A0A3L8PTE0_9GAMM|nr:relaxase/mobilization nuclease domain-containing protein [Parashewanella curva]RLV58554.1 DNA relaxase [Parashewanella curva]
MNSTFDTDLLRGSVHHKANRISQNKRARFKAPEVMLKISGHCRNVGHIQSHFDYISRNGKLEIEDELGQTYQEPEVLHQMAKNWCKDSASSRNKARHTTHLILSMPNGTEPQAVKKAARAFAKKTFADNHQYVFALHTDTDSPHVHLTVKNLGFNGKRLHIKKGQPQIWREQFANELEQLGISAEATPKIKPWQLPQPNAYFKIRVNSDREELER